MRALRSSLLVILFAAGCTPQVMQIDLAYVQTNTYQPKMSNYAVPKCIWVLDYRSTQTAHYKQVSSENALAWLKSGIENHWPNTSVLIGDPPTEYAPRMELHRLYVKHLTTSMSGVASLAYVENADVTNVRGQQLAVNWNGRKNEYIHVMNRALDDALNRLGSIETKSDQHQCP